MVPQKLRPDMTKPLPSVQPNIIEGYDGKCSTSFQHKVHISPSGPNIILPEFLFPPPRVQTAQPPRVDRERPSSNLRSRGKKNPIPNFAFTEKSQKINEANKLPIKYLEWPRNTELLSKSQTEKAGEYLFQINWDS